MKPIKEQCQMDRMLSCFQYGGIIVELANLCGDLRKYLRPFVYTFCEYAHKTVLFCPEMDSQVHLPRPTPFSKITLPRQIDQTKSIFTAYYTT